jgi:Sugar-specific transcriptional regulator TrmB
MQFTEYFQHLGYSEKDALIWKTLYRLGTQTASIVARESSLERTYTYKTLMRLTDDGIIALTEKNGVKYFFIPDIDILKKRTIKERERYELLERDFAYVATELQNLKEDDSNNLPKIRIYEWTHGIENLYREILSEIQKYGYREILLFASNILEQSNGQDTLGLHAKWFIEEIAKQKVSIDTYIGNGISLLESIGTLWEIQNITKLPASGGSTQIWIVWGSIYITLFKKISFWMRIENNELTGIMRFLLEQTRVKR